jgi:hypothetical protein
VISVTDERSTSVSKEVRKLRCIHAVTVEAQSVATDSLLGQSQEMFVHVENDNSDSVRNSDTNQAGDDEASENGAELNSVSEIAPLNTDHDTDQSVFY